MRVEPGDRSDAADSGWAFGRALIGVEFGVVVGPVSLKPDEGYPGAIITANKLMLSATEEGKQPPNMVFDAAVLNPKKK